MVNGDRFVITTNRGTVNVLDTDNVSGENLQVFYADLEDNEIVAEYIAYELENIVRCLNEQDRIIKKQEKILNNL